jgi:hypothetical protein
MNRHSAHDLPKTTRRARRWRRLKDAGFPLLSGIAIAAFTFGALSERIADRDDLLSDPLEAALLGIAFALGAFPRRWAVFARALIFVPTFFLYLSVFLGKTQPLPFGGAFAGAGFYAFFFTALSAYFSERPRLLRLRSQRRQGPRPSSAHS